jgi:hypothetical protein
MSLAQLAAYAGVNRANFDPEMGYCTSETWRFRNIPLSCLQT